MPPTTLNSEEPIEVRVYEIDERVYEMDGRVYEMAPSEERVLLLRHRRR